MVYLPRLLVDPALQLQILAVDLRRWHNPRAHRAEGVAALSNEPLHAGGGVAQEGMESEQLNLES